MNQLELHYFLSALSGYIFVKIGVMAYEEFEKVGFSENSKCWKKFQDGNLPERKKKTKKNANDENRCLAFDAWPLIITNLYSDQIMISLGEQNILL